jgi:hypothetical protein
LGAAEGGVTEFFFVLRPDGSRAKYLYKKIAREKGAVSKPSQLLSLRIAFKNRVHTMYILYPGDRCLWQA